MKKFTFLILVVVSFSSVFANRINYKLAVENKILKQQVLKLTLALKQANCAPVSNTKEKRQIALLQNKNAQLQKLYEVALCEKQELAKTVNELQACVADYKIKYEGAGKQIAQLENSYTQVCSKRDVWKNKYNDACGEIAQLQGSYAQACAEISQLEKTYSAACNERNDWKNKYHELHRKNDTLKTQNEKAYSQLAGLDSIYKATCEERDGFKNQYANACVKVQTLEQQVADLQEENARLQSACHKENIESTSCSSQASCTTNVQKSITLQFSKFFSHRSARKIVKTLQNSGWEVTGNKSDYLGNIVVTVKVDNKNSLKKVFRQVKKTLRSSNINIQLQAIHANTIAIIPTSIFH